MIALLIINENWDSTDINRVEISHPEEKVYTNAEVDEMIKSTNNSKGAKKLAILNYHISKGFRLATSNIGRFDVWKFRETEFYLECPES